MTRVEAGGLELWHGVRIDPACCHEIKGVADMIGHFAELLGPGTAAHEVQRPCMNLMQIGITTLRKSRSEEHTSELQSLMRISYAVFCSKKKKKPQSR